MENPDFWHDKWKTDKIGFHKDYYHSSLVKYWAGLNLAKNTAVFVPLCGKSSDMIWLAEQGHTVIGNELNAIAARDFFTKNIIKYEITKSGKFRKYQGGAYTILVGDFFDLAKADVPNIKAVYDRAALIALPSDMRQRYVEHIKSIINSGTQLLLITLAYDQASMDGPPFSVTTDEVQSKFGAWCKINALETSPPEDFRGTNANETVYEIAVK
ncbi:thiopurine S-methyltransferase [bacterium AH-315-J23]|nr:thiopurine S-methyltransferase [bacterium AH-315-J23]PHQ67102.1 MAG: thiopurine S-methyltransferase [Robiginitomaculum sp.]